MATDAVILVESQKKDKENIPEYLIFVRGDKFESSWSFAKALEEFCGKNTAGFVMSYSAGISLKEFETRFSDEFLRVNVLFARNPEDLNILKKRFGVVDADNAMRSLSENDWIKPKKHQPQGSLPPGATHDNIHFNTNDFSMLEREGAPETAGKWETSLNILLIIFIIIAAIVGIIWLPIDYAYRKICQFFGLLIKISKNRQGM